MGLAHRQLSHEKFRTDDPVGTPHEALEKCRRQLLRVRLELAELKRTGSRQGLADLSSKALMLSMQMRRLESLLKQERRANTRTGSRLLVFPR